MKIIPLHISLAQEPENQPDRQDDENDRYDKAKLVCKSDESIRSSRGILISEIWVLTFGYSTIFNRFAALT